MPAATRQRARSTALWFAQLCFIAMAALLCAGFGLLVFGHLDHAPAWLRGVLLGSATLAGLSLIGWMLARAVDAALGAHTRWR